MTLKFRACMSLFFFQKKSLPVHRSETGISEARPCVHDRRFMRRMAGRGIAKCCSPPEAHRGDEGYGVRPPTLAAWLHHDGAGTSGANWLHYNYWVSTFKGAHSLILPAHSGEVRVDHDANISRKVPLWPVCVGGPRGKKWSWVDPSLSIVLGGLE